MNTIVTINLVISSALIVAGSKLEATEGQNATLYFDIDEVEKADQVKIAFKQDNKENAVVVAQRPWTYDETPPPEVSLLVEEGRVNITIQHVSISRNSGVYKARAYFGKYMFEVNATLVINKPQFSSRPAPLHTATPKPLNSSGLKWLYVIIPVVVIIIIIIIIIRRECEPAVMVKEPEKLSDPRCVFKKELENRCNSYVSVTMNSCEEKAEPLLTDTQVS